YRESPALLTLQTNSAAFSSEAALRSDQKMGKQSYVLIRKAINIAGRHALISAGLLTILFLTPQVIAQQGATIRLGHVQSGASVTFTRVGSGEWGIEIAGGPAPRMAQTKPASIEVDRAGNDIHELAAGYKTVRKTPAGIDAQAEIAGGDNVIFRVHDKWAIASGVLSLHRTVSVKGSAP